MTPAPASPAGASAGRVHLDTDANIAILTLDRPAKLNALTGAMTAELAGHVAAVNADPAVRCVVLTGTGRAFRAGSDVAELDRYRTPWEFGLRRDYGDVLRSLRKPSIAAASDVTAFLAGMARIQAPGPTQNTASMLRTFLTWLYAEGLIASPARRDSAGSVPQETDPDQSIKQSQRPIRGPSDQQGLPDGAC